MSYSLRLWRENLNNHTQGIVVNAAAVIGLSCIIDNHALPWLHGWIAGALLLCLLRYALERYSLRDLLRHPQRPPPGWQRGLLAAGLIGSALMWSLNAAYGLPHYSANEKFSVMIIISALAGGATGTLASMRIIGKLYIASLLLPTCLAMWLSGDDKLAILAVLGIIFAFIMFNSHANNFKLLSNTLSLSSDKEALIRQLSEKNRHISDVNSHLEQRIQERTQALEFLANHDPLTSLLNRRGFLSYSYASGTDLRHQTLIFIDLDHFKDINEGMGHEHGDQLLQAFSQRLSHEVAKLARHIGASDHPICRWGGDEFVLCLLRAVDQQDDGRAHYRQLHAALSASYHIGPHQVHLGLSMGIFESITATLPQMQAALTCADIATSEAKKNGRGQISFYSEASYTLQRRRLKLTQALAQAHQDGSLHLLYQPIYTAGTGQIASYEALLRWRHAEYGNIVPDEFIALAETSNAIQTIGRWVLEQACRQAASWPTAPGQPQPPRIAINTSIRQLVQPGYSDLVSATLQQCGLAPQRLIIEVTESVLDERNMDRASASLSALHGLGVEIHLDDFGTGYSSLSRLRQLPLDALKIDKSFVTDMDEKSLTVIEAALLIARRYGLRVVAEGVESAQQIATLRSMGVDELQGYHLGRPAPLPAP
ncbi:putative bifunctional diguanylate cyclase/phosphodiesterase [Pseudoduganella danionis]|uniref:EAL domain-containing protein n=1 Tax=Pseudoduganella danionis TaxID=1890295 RepID=A0ABW9SSA8_9BURK|nr:bifunctional diguanylate cyclase/phosphodiesterase [Pseudoduganella danionis]MTW34897.1 EAL domain-containing protein [Pseudoduganella danionis]